MKNIYFMIGITILFFLLSFDVLFQTSVYIDITLVLIYLLLVAQLELNLDTNMNEEKEVYVLTEKKTSYFAPMIIMPFLGLTYSFGIIPFSINIVVIVLLYIYTYFIMKRNNITLTKEGLSVVYLNNKSDSILFKDVVKVDFNWIYNYIGLYDETGKKVILDITLKDFKVVINAIKEYIPTELSNEMFRKLSTFYKVFLVDSNAKYLE